MALQIVSCYNGSVYAASTLRTNQSSPSVSAKLRNVFLPCFEYNKHKMASLRMFSPTSVA